MGVRGLAPSVEIVAVGRRRVAYHHATGRHVPLPEGEGSAISPGLAGRLGREGMIAGNEWELETTFPARAWLAMSIGQVLWHADPRVAPRGGHGWTATRLSPLELATWSAVDGRRTVRQVAACLGREVGEVVGALRRFTHPGVQAMQLRQAPARPGDVGLQRVLAPEPGPAPREPGMYDPDGSTQLARWHEEVPTAEAHFDDVETTVAHALGLPHPGLQGRSYGEALFDRFAARGWVRGPVVEVGPGSGQLAEAFLARAGRPLDYTRVDASPALLAAQDRRLPRTRGRLGSALELPLPDGSVDLLFANEVIADLPSRPAPGGWDNHGSRRFLEEIGRVLRPGGKAWLSEFGTVDGEPEEAVGLDHPEVSIQFTALAEHARALGFVAEVRPLHEELGLDLRAPQLWRGSYEGLRAWTRAQGGTLEARAWTPSNLPLPCPVDGLHFVDLADRGPGPLVTRFYALSLEAPGRGSGRGKVRS